MEEVRDTLALRENSELCECLELRECDDRACNTIKLCKSVFVDKREGCAG